MCNLSLGVYEEAVSDTTVTHIINLMESMGWDIDMCMDKLKVPAERRDVYKEAVEAELQMV